MVSEEGVSLEPKHRVRALAEHGAKIEVDSSVPIRRYFRSGREMIRMANVYYDEKNWENAFILYSKYITIFVEKLPKHPEYKSARPDDLKASKKNLKSAFPNAEDTKKRLSEKYAEEYQIWQAQEEERRVEKARLRQLETQKETEERERREQEDAMRAEEERRALENHERLAIDQQQRELDEQKAALLDAKMKQEAMDRDMAWKMTEEQKIEQARHAEANRRLAGSVATPIAAGAAVAGLSAAAGSLPPPPSYNAVAQGYGIKPEQFLPSAPTDPSAPRAPFPSVDRSLKVDRSTKPSNQMLSVASTTGTNKHGLRDLLVPMDTMDRFLALADKNTRQNLETCGILAGRLARDAFTITHIIVPKQTSTSDSCTALNEEDIFDFVDNNDLITLGWIHTHPSQTAFMSSIDLHTHCPYQIMMPEAIAIVCAPKHNQTGFFSLTPDYGVSFIANCRQKGFHPHPSQPPIYEEGAHCKLRPEVPSIKIADLR